MEEDKKVNDTETKKFGKVPKRIIHFSDGEVPEYSDDEDAEDSPVTESRIMTLDPSSLSWVDWLRFKSGEIGLAALNVCDYLGESLSSFFGITTPKYQFEIDHYNMMKKLETETADAEMGSINENNDTVSVKAQSSA